MTSAPARVLEQPRPDLLFGREVLARHLPHRSVMLLLDGITAFEEGQSCTSVRRIRGEEPFLEGHFPGNPIVPGIYLIENMAQTACFLLERSFSGLPGTPVLARVELSTFSSPVRPGAELVTQASLERTIGTFAMFHATCAVMGRVAARASFVVGRALERALAQAGLER